ncbi:MAG: PepSY-like domain-containing protein [Bacteroidaceae bacterium]|nr:PepSY-like domain-containing protein [Bacteroidaceae bacterium]
MKRFIIPLALMAILAFVACDNSGNIRETLRSKVESQYPGAVIMENDRDFNGMYEVEIYHNSQKKDVYYNYRLNWVYTKWDIPLSELPSAVAQNVTTSYPNYYINDASFVEAPGSTYYEVEIEKGNIEKELRVSPNGQILGSI